MTLPGQPRGEYLRAQHEGTPVNPLLENSDLPPFDRMAADHVRPAITELLAAAEAALERAVGPDVAADWDALSLVLGVPVERLFRVWGYVGHLQSVCDTPALRAAHAEAQALVIDFATRMGADERLYAKYKAVAAGPGAARLTAAQRKALSDTLRDFVLGGAELQGAARLRHAAIQARTAELSQQFGDHVLDATDAWSLSVPAERLAGVPKDVIDAALAAAQAAGESGCRLTLQAPCYVPVMQYADQRGLREQLYRAYATRASELGPPALDNSPLMSELLQLRHESAALLGYPSHAHALLPTKMARTPQAVLAFVRDLARRARPHAERELAELRDFAATELALPDLQAWDRAYASEKLKQQRYAFSSQALKAYFVVPRVLDGLFHLVEGLFGVTLRPDTAPVWHDTVRYYTVWRDGQQVAAFYLDAYARAGKQSGAWMNDCRSRWLRPGNDVNGEVNGGLQLPVAHLVCNFALPVGGRPGLLTHDDVITLFHEFGHGLHHMLTQVDERSVAGISGVEGDAVELPSQFMENFCWEWEALQRLSAHVDTAAPLPRDLFDRMTAARHFQSGLQLLRQCEFSLFDMRLHTEPAAATHVQALCDEVNAEVQPMRAPDFLRYPNSFGHLFDGGYAAGYYGYAWAEVLSADAFSAFEEAGVFDPATGARFREQILEVGGSRPALDSFRAFRGREPQIDAMLRHQGLA